MGNLKELRDKTPLSQEGLARETGLSVGTIAKIERGEQVPSLPTSRKIAEALAIFLPQESSALLIEMAGIEKAA